MRFNILIVVWGDVYVEYLSEIALPSLAPSADELATLTQYDWHVTVATRKEDVARIEKILRTIGWCKPHLIEFEPDKFPNPYAAMADGHFRCAQRSIEIGAYGIVMPPDVVASAGMLAHLVKLADAGKRVVMTVGPRIRASSAYRPLKSLLAEGPIAQRLLARIGGEHVHPEWERYFWTSPNFSSRPFVLYWNAPDGWLSHNFHLHPLLIDFSAAATIDVLKGNTIDGDFVHEAFNHAPDVVHIVQDSDELLLLSLTPDDVYYSDPAPGGASVETVREVAFHDIVNPMHRWFVRKPIRIHWGDIDERWMALEASADRIIDGILAVRSPSVTEHPIAPSHPLAVATPFVESDWTQPEIDLLSAKSTGGGTADPRKLSVSEAASILGGTRSQSPVFISTPVWGTGHIAIFLEIGLPSLMSEGNLPTVAATHDVRYLIHTRQADLQLLQDGIQKFGLSEILNLELVPFDLNVIDTHRTMSDCHMHVMRLADASNGVALFVPPDCIWSENSLAAALHRIDTGMSMVHIPGIRIEKERARSTFAAARSQDGRQLSVTPRQLVSGALPLLHRIAKTHFWKSDEGALYPANLMWRVGDNALLLRNFHLHPFAIKSQIPGAAFFSTIDDDLALAACPDASRDYIVADSDEMVVFEMSDAARWLGTACKKGSISDTAAWAQGNTNARHRDFIRKRIRVHGGDVNPTLWRTVEQASDKDVSAILKLSNMSLSLLPVIDFNVFRARLNAIVAGRRKVSRREWPVLAALVMRRWLTKLLSKLGRRLIGQLPYVLTPLGDAFDSTYYLATNTDVLEAGVEPLYHYVFYGRKEGRFPNKRVAAEVEAIVNHYFYQKRK